MDLSKQAIEDLRKVLAKETGGLVLFTDEELNEVGMFVLTAVAERLKMGK